MLICKLLNTLSKAHWKKTYSAMKCFSDPSDHCLKRKIEPFWILKFIHKKSIPVPSYAAATPIFLRPDNCAKIEDAPVSFSVERIRGVFSSSD